MRFIEFKQDILQKVDQAISAHVEQGVPFTECIFRPGSDAFNLFYKRVREQRETLDMDWQDVELLDTNIGESVMFEGQMVSLDVPFEDLDPEGPELTIGNYTTTHFYMCGSAIKTAEKHTDKPGMERLIRLQDMIYKLERAVMDAGESTPEAKELVQKLHDETMDVAKEIGIEEEVGAYQIEHLNSVLKGDPKPGFGRVDEDVTEAKYKGREVKLNSPKRGGPKKFYVYVKTKKGNVKKLAFGAAGMPVKTTNPERVRNFVARHDCKNRNDKTTASYWSCRLPSYKSLGIKGGQWW